MTNTLGGVVNLAQDSFEKFHAPITPGVGERLEINTVAGILRQKGYNSYRAKTPANQSIASPRSSYPNQICGFNYQNDSEFDPIKQDDHPARNSLFTS